MSGTTQLPGRRGRPRSAASEQAVLRAAIDLLAEGESPAAITIAEIARRAGAGKDTIYRRWQCKEDLLVDALAAQVGELDIPDSASLREVLVITLTELIERLQSDRARRLSRAMQSAGDDFPKLRARYVDTVIRRRRELIAEHVRAAVARGELRPGLDLEHVVQMPFHYVLFSAINREPV
ncbi:MAG: TetR/AcrR family transcriptional regulator, partial [Conexibacteraceae bacterium]|nr:TetR/AcrR family transcriptional regulator [Conexibacteraceae bacterium]